MIKYENGGIHFLLKLVQREGSVFPMAVSVGFGILFATFVILLLVPACLAIASPLFVHQPAHAE